MQSPFVPACFSKTNGINNSGDYGMTGSESFTPFITGLNRLLILEETFFFFLPLLSHIAGDSQPSQSTRVSTGNNTSSMQFKWNQWNGFDKYCLFSQLPDVHVLQNTARGNFHNCFYGGKKIQILIRSWIISQALRSDNIWSPNWPAAVHAWLWISTPAS